jgi:rhodanese-related sulfurtransferase
MHQSPAEAAVSILAAAVCRHFREKGIVMAVERISAQQAHQEVRSGKSLLVCAYDSKEKFRDNHLEGAISFSEFESRKNGIPKNQEIVFYCA